MATKPKLTFIQRGHKLNEVQMHEAAAVLAKATEKNWSTGKLEKQVDIALNAAGCPVPPNPVRVGQHRNRGQFQLTCVGGPWDGQAAVFPRQESPDMNRGVWSLPIRVGEYVGRYNLNTGAWVPMETTI
jgi:hypothetical protein